MKYSRTYNYGLLRLLLMAVLAVKFSLAQPSRTAQNKNNTATTQLLGVAIGTVSVKDFGAVGNGLTDDTYAVQTAVNSGATGIYFPTTVHGYKIGTIYINKPLSLFGDNKQGTVITPLKSNMNMFVCTSTFVSFKGIYFVAFKGITTKDTAIHLRSSINTIEDCFFSNMEVGIFNNSKYNADEQYIKNCRFRDCTYGIYSNGFFRNSRISDFCIFHTCKSAISLYDNNDYVHTTEGVVIESALIYDCGDAAMNKGAIDIENCDFTFIRNCMVDLNRYTALSVKESKWCDISGTYFSSNHSVSASSVRISGDCTDMFLRNCRFVDSRQWGLEILGLKKNPSNISISDCSFRLNPSGDIIVNGANNIRINNSNFYTNSASSISGSETDGMTSIWVTNCSIAGGISKGTEKVRITLKDCFNKPTYKTGSITIPTGQRVFSFAHGLTVLKGQSVNVSTTSNSTDETVSASITGENIVLTRKLAADKIQVNYTAEVY